MRAKLVHGTNSMTWANKVLPIYMRAPWGSQPRESTRFLANAVQVGTKLNRPAARANACSRARHGSFNRTVVTSSIAVAIHQDRLEAPLKQMPDLAVPAVERLRKQQGWLSLAAPVIYSQTRKSVTDRAENVINLLVNNDW